MQNPFLCVIPRSLACILILFFLGGISKAAQLGDLTYFVSGGSVTITRCALTATGVVTIPETIAGSPVTRINDRAFENCEQVTGVILPDSLTTLGFGAFRFCYSLISMTIPASVTSIGEIPFSACTAMESVEVDAANPNYLSLDGVLYNKDVTALIQCPAGKAGALVIPDTVTSIPSYGISRAAKLTSVTLPSGLLTMGIGALQICDLLEEIVLPSTLTEIPPLAFSNCVSLRSINIPENVTSIGSNAFSGCTVLSGVVLPQGLTTLGSYAFADCPLINSLDLPASLMSMGVTAMGTHIASFTLDEANTSFTASNGMLFPADRSQVLLCQTSKAGTVELPVSVTEIVANAFANCVLLTELTIPANVTVMGNYCFRNCTGLTTVTIPSQVVSMGSRPFWDCDGLLSVSMPTGLVSAVDSVFYDCGSLSHVTMRHSTVNPAATDSGTLTGLPALKNVVISEGIKTIPQFAFKSCVSMESVTLPESLTEIGKEAFFNTGIKQIHIPAGVTTLSSGKMFEQCVNLKTVSFGGTISQLWSSTFKDCSSLTDIVLPAGMKTIWTDCFKGCSELETINLPASLTTLSSQAFENCSKLRSVALPAGLTDLGAGAFRGCASLAAISIPLQITSLSNGVFDGCSSLEELRIPGNVRTIGQSCFRGCSNLKSLVFEEGVESINSEAFANCSSLVTLDLPLSLTYSGYGMLSGATKLRDLYVGTQTAGFFGNFNTVFIEGSLNLKNLTIKHKPPYDYADSSSFRNWGFEFLTIMDGVTYISYHTFSSNLNLRSVSLPASLNKIQSPSFSSAVESLIFRGNAPQDISSPPWPADSVAVVYHFDGATGFTSPTWQGLPTVNMGAQTPVLNWRLDHRVTHDTPMSTDQNGDGVPLLLAYALGQDPNENLNTRQPRAVLENEELCMDFYAGTAGVNYVVETSENLTDWSEEGVSLSALDENQMRKAVYSGSGANRFMRLKVSE